jgi:phage head maturation protease
MICCAAPYGLQSTAIDRDGGLAYEILAPGCFAASLASRKAVRLRRGHGGPIISRVSPREDARGLWFEWDGELPADFSFSVGFKAVRWERIGPQVFRLLEAKLKHIALLSGDEVPVYPQTRILTLNSQATELASVRR